MELAQKLAHMRQIDLFEAFTDDALTMVAEVAQYSKTDAEETIFLEGDSGDKMYFILEGEVSVTKENQQGETVLISVLNENEYFGELAILVNCKRTATLKTISPCQFLTIRQRDMDALIEKYPAISQQLTKILAFRLADTLHLLSQKERKVFVLLTKDPATPAQKHFIQYFKRISTKTMTHIPSGTSPESIERTYHHLETDYLIIESPEPSTFLNKLANHIISFKGEHPNAIHIPDDCSFPEIEHHVRTITNTTIGLALSSGGLPAFAHLGVLDVFRENEIPVDYITGTSIGAICAALYAFQISPEKIHTFIQQQQNEPLTPISDFALKRGGLFRGKQTIKLLKALLQDRNLQDTQIPFTALATELFSGTPRLMKDGNSVDALRASCSVPLIYTPVKRNGEWLVDGMVSNPLPLNVLEDEAIDIKVAISIPANTEAHQLTQKLPNVGNIYLRSRGITAAQLSRNLETHADVLIKPDVAELPLMDPKQIAAAIEKGREAATKALPRLQKFINI